MAYPTAVNSQITDSVSQVNAKVLGDAPAMAVGALDQALAHALGMLFENAVQQQQQAAVVAEAATAAAVALLYRAAGLAPPPPQPPPAADA